MLVQGQSVSEHVQGEHVQGGHVQGEHDAEQVERPCHL